MSNIVPFEKAPLPAFLAQLGGEVNHELTDGAMGGFPVMSIKGKTWAVKRGDERHIVMRQDDPDEPASSIEVVILRANPVLTKTYFVQSFKEGSDDKPTCFSNDGQFPDRESVVPQARSCAACKHNVFGSGTNDKGEATNGKACSDVRRIAIAPAGQINDPMLLRIPPASLKSVSQYGQGLNKRGVPFHAVITKMRFDPESASPLLVLSTVDFCSEEQFNQAAEQRDSDLVKSICGIGEAHPISDEEYAEKTAGAEAKAESKPKAETKPKAPAKPKAEKQPESKPASEEEVAAAVSGEAKAEAKSEVKVTGDLGDLGSELDDALSALDQL